MMHWLGLALAALTAAGCLYTLCAAFLVARFGRGDSGARPAVYPSVTILKPLHGSEPQLRENLLSFCLQDYPAPLQIVFGVQDRADAAIADVNEIIATLPARDLSLVVCGREHGVNPKISNLINMEPAIRGDVVVLADSDMRVERGYLTDVVAGLSHPGVGAVTCAYRGRVEKGRWSGLADLGIDSHFLPGVIAGLALGLAHPCFGSTIAMRRETLSRIGGFAAFRNTLADDHAMGEAVRRLGLSVCVPPFLLSHTGPAPSLADLISHELRWARTVANVDATGFIGSGITHVFPLALLAFALLGPGALAFGLLAAALLSRFSLLLSVVRRFRLENVPFWLLPARDILSFFVYLTCFISRDVRWRGRNFSVAADGTMEPRKESR